MVKPHFRAGVVAVVRRSNGQVMAFERADSPGAWQLPQGGIESGETPEQAVWRELWEETGLSKRDVRLVEQPPHWTIYEWPADMRTSDRIGQAHRWFFFEPLDDQVTPQPDGSEFTDWRWMTAPDLIDCVVEFRRGPYAQVLGNGDG
jgi:putative (di)nucleoside polyphosphate hydrolase